MERQHHPRPCPGTTGEPHTMATDIREQTTQASQAEETRTGRWYRPPVDILERGDELLIVADRAWRHGRERRHRL